jgi:DUF1680 family protein
MLEKTGTIDNFRLVAKLKEGFRAGQFYCDSDAYKWLEAACLIYANYSSEKLKGLIFDFIKLLQQAQAPNGYLYTYNQLHFPNDRWTNLQIQHELYSLGHLIEAAVAHYSVFNERSLLDIGINAADLCVRELLDGTPLQTCGHEEIEIALIKLFRITSNHSYLQLSQNMLERRGKIPHLMFELIREGKDYATRSKKVKIQLKNYIQSHPDYAPVKIPAEVIRKHTFTQTIRAGLMALNGKLLQQHVPLRKMKSPEGHAVRFVYLMTAATMLAQETMDESLLKILTELWDRMVSRRMYLTGGIGALPTTEGFGYDYELPNQYAYGETCAALGSIFWNWQMLLSTHQPKYADLLEWQLYNAASSGIAYDGNSYLYRNPLEADEVMKREPWFGTPCCPSNVSRAWAVLSKYCYTNKKSSNSNEITIEQYISNKIQLDKVKIELESLLPWDGKIIIKVDNENDSPLELNLRIPHWVKNIAASLDQKNLDVEIKTSDLPPEPPASAFSPYNSSYYSLLIKKKSKILLSLTFGMDATIHYAPENVKTNRGRIALSRGPLVYCLESVDHRGADIRNAIIDQSKPIETHFSKELFGGIYTLHGKFTSGDEFIAVPYFLWANRGPSKMAVWVKASQN